MVVVLLGMFMLTYDEPAVPTGLAVNEDTPTGAAYANELGYDRFGRRTFDYDVSGYDQYGRRRWYYPYTQYYQGSRSLYYPNSYSGLNYRTTQQPYYQTKRSCEDESRQRCVEVWIPVSLR